MTRLCVRACVVLGLVGCVGLAASAQNAAATLTELNSLLAAACFNTPTLTMGAGGAILRKNGDGSAHTFTLSDIGEVVADVPDAQANIVLRCKDDKPCIEYLPARGGPKTTGKITVFTVNVSSNTHERLLKLFLELHATARTAGR